MPCHAAATLAVCSGHAPLWQIIYMEDPTASAQMRQQSSCHKKPNCRMIPLQATVSQATQALSEIVKQNRCMLSVYTADWDEHKHTHLANPTEPAANASSSSFGKQQLQRRPRCHNTVTTRITRATGIELNHIGCYGQANQAKPR